ncbi:MAG: polyphosphate kinase 1 [Bradymonadia bacterium]
MNTSDKTTKAPSSKAAKSTSKGARRGRVTTRGATRKASAKAPRKALTKGRAAKGNASESAAPPSIYEGLGGHVTVTPDDFFNRELSVLEFNRRVLYQARNPATPLLERLRFLTISCSNLDEFFEVRVAGYKQQVAFGLNQTGPDGRSPQEVLRRISDTAHGLVSEQYETLNTHILPALEEVGIRLLKRSVWDAAQAAWIEEYFEREVLPVLTPMGLDPAHPFPRVLNKGLNFIVSLEGLDAFGRDSGVAVLQVPRCLPRIIGIPETVSGKADDFVLISSVIHAHIGELFPGMKITGCHQFRVTRNSDLFVDEEEVDDLLRALKGELANRNFGDGVRLEVAANCPQHMVDFLLGRFALSEADLYRENGPVNMHRLVALCDLVDRPELKYTPFTPGLPEGLSEKADIFASLRKHDLLLHHPFDAFAPVVEMVRQAAQDPDVLAIKQTLYRTGKKSPLVEALIEAARSGKEVTAVVELRARFDEAANIGLATKLQEAGANVVYGVVGHKCHAKLLLVVRREGNRLRRYVHLGTGNYHSGTAKAYTDFSLMTADPDLGHDVHQLFMQLTGLGRLTAFKKVIQAPFRLHKTMVEHIRREMEHARAGRPARIIAKMNSLSEPAIIAQLYQASQAGVEIDLIIRGICCLRPGVPGLSERIRVRSIVGRFLEHTRVYYFENGGDEVVYCASADWMERNFHRRVEACFPVEDPELFLRIKEEGLLSYLKDDTQAWLLQPDGTYTQVTRVTGQVSPPHAAQVWLMGLSR